MKLFTYPSKIEVFTNSSSMGESDFTKKTGCFLSLFSSFSTKEDHGK